MQAVLVMFRNDGERRSFSISRDMMVIGRRQDCDLMIPLGEISRKHCRIIRDDDTLRLEDLGSSNGTFHNGRRIQEAVLEPGDTVQIGPVSFVVQIDGVPDDDEIQPNTKNAAIADDDELEALDGDDDLQATPGHELDDELEPLGEDGAAAVGSDDDLEELGLDEDVAPKSRRK
jgi:pSer/pThr/pTyr-binding forkhead associated (FHA) protein